MKSKLLQRSLTALFAGVIGLISVATMIYLKDLNLKEQGESLDLLRRIEVVHHKLNGKVLAAHSLGVSDYDALVRLSQESSQICEELLSSNWISRKAAYQALHSRSAEFCAMNSRRLANIERFKSKNSVLKNSVSYMQTLVSELAGSRYHVPALRVSNKILGYTLSPNPSLEKQISEDLKKLNSLSPAHVKTNATERTFARHASVIMSATLERYELEQEVLSPETSKALEGLRVAYLNSYRSKAEHSAQVQFLLAAFCIGLALLLARLFYKLQKTGASLTNLNSTLENKVEIRTQELRIAMTRLEEQQLQISQVAKMSALGEMAGGMAHEINTPLAAIALNSELLELEAEKLGSAELVEGLQTISRIVEQISKVISGLRRFARTGESGVRTPTVFSSILEDTLLLCGERLKSRSIRFSFVKKERDPLLSCAPEQIAQVLVNLLNNAVDAVESVSVKNICVEDCSTETEFILTVTDSGKPMEARVREKIMQPFFTTKEIGKGTGLGLSISRGIAASHGGSLELDPNSVATRFILRLPVLNEKTGSDKQVA